MQNQFLSYLKSRTLLKQTTSESISDDLCLYCGFDVTAKSLHFGHLIPIMILKIAKEKFGCKTIAIIGSGTTRLGDPTWKTETRPIIDLETIADNANHIRTQITSIANPDYILDNADWYADMNMLDFIRDVGAFFSVNQLTNMETFDERLRNNKHLSFMEFCYPLLQSYDFKVLFEKYKCNMQIGGSDQWGNITQGVSFIKKSINKEVYGITTNLMLNAGGQKMGKTVNGALWLDKNMCSVYDFWQYFRNLPDADIENVLLKLTDIDSQKIRDIVKSDIIAAKKLLADSVTSIVHGQTEAQIARGTSESIFEKGDESVYEIIKWHSANSVKLEQLIFDHQIAPSKAEAKRLILSGAVLINNIKVQDPNMMHERNNYIICIAKKRYIKIIK